MALKFIDKSSSKVVEKPIRNLIINGVERYRLEIRKTNSHKINSNYSKSLVYAKGKVNLNLNWPKDGSGKKIDYSSRDNNMPSSVYVFYKENCFFYKSGNSYSRYYYYKKDSSVPEGIVSTLSQLLETQGSNIWNIVDPAGSHHILKFKGWYTAKKGGKKVETIDDIDKKTNLFKYNSTNKLPEITLYCQWEIKTWVIKVHNITRKCDKNLKKKSTSSFEYYDEKTKKWIKTTDTAVFKKVLYGTNIISFLNKNIKNPRYITWAYDALDGTKQQQALRSGPQKFLNWCYSDWGSPKPHYTYDDFIKSTDRVAARVLGGSYDGYCYEIYPYFESIYIWKNYNIPKGTEGTEGHFGSGDRNQYWRTLKDKERKGGGYYSLLSYNKYDSLAYPPDFDWWKNPDQFKVKNGSSFYDQIYYHWTYQRDYYRGNGYWDNASTHVYNIAQTKWR